MSNLSILERIEEQVGELQRGELTTRAFVDFLDASTEALEALPYAEVQRARDLQHKVEVAGFSDEEDCISDLPSVTQEIKTWIQELKERIPNQ
jgi:hypothetical protein